MGKEARLILNQQWFLFLSTTLASLVNLFLPLILVRILSPQEVGEYKIFFLYLQSVPMLFFSSGILSGVPFWSGRKENGQIYLRQAFSIILLIIFLFLILGLISFYPLKMMGITSSYYFLFIFSSMLWMISPFFEEVMIAEGMLFKASALIFSSEFIRAALMIFAALKTRNLTMVFAGFLISVVIKIALGSYWLRPLNLLKLTWIESIKSQVLKYSLPLSTATFFNFFIEKSDQIILTLFISAGDFAAYSLACLTIPPLLMLEQSVTRVLLPKLARNASDPNKMVEDYQIAVTHLGLLIIPATIGLITFSRPIILLLFSNQYEAGHWYLKVYALSYLFLIFPHDLFHRAMDKSRWIMKTFFVLAPIGFVITCILTLFFKAWGALVALLLTKAIFKIVYFIDLKKTLNITGNQLIPIKTLSRFLLVSLFLMVLSIAIKSFFSTELEWLVVMGLTFLITYLVIMRKYLHRFKQD